MISSKNKIVLWLVLFFVVLILVILKRGRLGGMKTPLLALIILLGITIPDRFFTLPYFHRPGGGGEILFQPSYESNTPDLNNLTYNRMEKIKKYN